jgi:hypothetical protein
MIEDEDRAADDGPAPGANDNGNDGVQGRIDAAVLTIARLIGRQMAREAFEGLRSRTTMPRRNGARTDREETIR